MRSMMLSLLFAMCLSGLSVSTASAGQASGLELNAQAVKGIATVIGAAQKELRDLPLNQRQAGITKTLIVGGKEVTITVDSRGRAKLSTGGVDLGAFKAKVLRNGSVALSVTSMDSRGRTVSLSLNASGNTIQASARSFYTLLGRSTRGIKYGAKAVISSIVLSVVTQTKANTTRQITVATLSGAVSP